MPLLRLPDSFLIGTWAASVVLGVDSLIVGAADLAGKLVVVELAGGIEE